jgi:prepilin-type N-terminal cleavage/methylation domain-containing protein
MKKKGFTLIELVVVVAIILLLAATLAPKLRKEVAKARDAKAVAALGAVRTAVNVYLADEGKGAVLLKSDGTGTGIIDTSGDSEYLEDNVVTFLSDNAAGEDPEEDATVKVGGTRPDSDGTLTYGGEIVIDYDPDEVAVVLTATSTDDFDTKGNEWAKY